MISTLSIRITLLRMTAEAGKDAYCEKPMGNVLEK